jgi:precorrin-2 dehydrogenase/sirohydrochlorin ferrochelatase
VRKLLGRRVRITVVSRDFTEDLLELGNRGEIELVKADLDEASSVIPNLVSGATVVITTTDSSRLNARITQAARDEGVLVCAVDMPALSDFYFPAVACRGSIRVGICTDGKSPLMSRQLRERIEGILTKEDSLQVELQHYARGLAKEHVHKSEQRREILYEIAGDPEIKRLLLKDKLEEAKKLARETVERS